MKNSSFCSHPPPFSAVAAAAFQTGPWECCTPTCQTPSLSPAPPVPAPGWPRLLPTSVWLPWAIPPSPPPRPREASARSPAWTSNVKHPWRHQQVHHHRQRQLILLRCLHTAARRKARGSLAHRFPFLLPVTSNFPERHEITSPYHSPQNTALPAPSGCRHIPVHGHRSFREL